MYDFDGLQAEDERRFQHKCWEEESRKEDERRYRLAKIKDGMYMEDVRDITVDASTLVEEKLKRFGITLTPEEEDAIHNKIWEILEKRSNGNYRHHM